MEKQVAVDFLKNTALDSLVNHKATHPKFGVRPSWAR